MYIRQPKLGKITISPIFYLYPTRLHVQGCPCPKCLQYIDISAQNIQCDIVWDILPQYDLTIDFQFLKHIKYYCCTEKSHCDATILTTKSIKNWTHFRFSTDFAFDFRLRWSHGTMRKSDGKSNTKSNESCDRTCTCLAWKRLIQ